MAWGCEVTDDAEVKPKPKKNEPMRGRSAPWPLYADGAWHVLGLSAATGYRSISSMASAAALWASTHGYRFNSSTGRSGVAIKLTRKDGRPQQAYWPTREKDAHNLYGIRGEPTRRAVFGGIEGDEFIPPPLPGDPETMVDPVDLWSPVNRPSPSTSVVSGRLVSSTPLPDGSLELVTVIGPDEVTMLRKALDEMGGESREVR